MAAMILRNNSIASDGDTRLDDDGRDFRRRRHRRSRNAAAGTSERRRRERCVRWTRATSRVVVTTGVGGNSLPNNRRVGSAEIERARTPRGTAERHVSSNKLK